MIKSLKSEIIHTKHLDFSSQYDYVFVFKMNVNNEGISEQSIPAKHCIHQMMQAGLDVYPYLSIQQDELIVLVRASDEILKKFADSIDYLMLCDEGNLEKKLKAGQPQYQIAPINITDDRKITPLSPYEYIYLKYETDLDHDLYYIPPGENSCFVKSIRLKLLYSLLQASKRDGGCDIEIDHLLNIGKILAFFPIHDSSIVEQLKTRCTSLSYTPWDFPMYDVKEYLGEKIALYTLFLGHYSYYLVIPSIVGIAFQIVVWATVNFSSPVLPFYSVVITVWSIVMLEYWKRQEAYTALTWGMSKFEETQSVRAEFIGDLMKSHIDGRDQLYYPTSKLQRRAAISNSIVTSFILLVLAVVTSIYILRFQLQKQASTQEYASTIASIINTISIQIFNRIYRTVVTTLTNNENHRTDTAYEDSLIIKLYVFLFVNSYSSFFFLAFIASNLSPPSDNPHHYIGQCAATNCMEPLSINLAIIYGTRLTIGNLVDVLIPYFTWKSKISEETKGVEDHSNLLSLPERDYYLVKYDSLQESIDNYADTAIQYGYTMLFVTALPISSFLSLLNNYVKLKIFSYRIFSYYQRPIPLGSQDIGTWMLIFQFISIVSVITNAGLICFTMNVLWKDFSLSGRVWIFIGFQWVLMCCQYIASIYIDDVSSEVDIQLQRTSFISQKIVDKIEDEDYGREIEREDDDDNQIDRRISKSCGGLITRKIKKKSSKRLLRGVNPFPIFPYPSANDHTKDAWPNPLNKNDYQLQTFVKGKNVEQASSSNNITKDSDNLPIPPV